ncbi:MAG: hypothetical protein PHT33_03925 [bacterium]|nr:hypothetical protein [bacterium]
MSRPKKEIDQKVFEGLVCIQCSRDEICSVLACDAKTLTRWCKDTYGEGFLPTYKKLNKSGKASLRRMQWKTAESGNATMQIWLGKQYLDQKDKQETELTGKDGGPMILKVVYDDGKPEGNNDPPAEATS